LNIAEVECYESDRCWMPMFGVSHRRLNLFTFLTRDGDNAITICR